MSCENLKEKNFRSNTLISLSYDYMNDLRKKQILCDTSVVIGSKIFSVHKIILASSSKYFDMMFTGGFKESNLGEITLYDIDSDAVEQLINYMYTSELKITKDNVQKIFVASNFLLMEDVDIECVKFMKENIHIENCLEYTTFADSNNLVELYDSCFSFILNNFSEVLNSSEFLLMSFEYFEILLQTNQLNAEEEKIYESIMMWVKYDLENRLQLLSGLIKYVQILMIPIPYFINYIESEEILRNHCPNFLYDTLKTYLVHYCMEPHHDNQNRTCRKNKLILIASYTNEQYNLEWMETEKEQISSIKLSFNSTILKDGKIFCTDQFSDMCQCVVANSNEFLLSSFEQIVELLQVDHSNVKEIKIYEFIMLWLKHDLKSRSQFLSKLLTSLNMERIPLNYFIEYIEKEALIKSSCTDFLYKTLKMFVVNQSMGLQLQMGRSDRKFRKNQLIIIASYTNGKYNLEWMTTENEDLSSNTFSWSTFNSIILNDGRIFCTKHCFENNNWSANMFNGTFHIWNSIGNIEFEKDNGVCSNLVELNECIYMMSPSGYFKHFNLRTKQWLDLEQLIDGRPKFRNLVGLDDFIYCISTNYLFKYNPNDNTWKVASKKDFSRLNGFACCSLDGCLYLFGGLTKGTYVKMAMKYNPSSDAWYDIADMNIARWHAGAVAVNGLIYVMGGDNCDSFEVYDPESDVWTLSHVKLGSKEHQRTRAFVLDPTTNLNSRSIIKYYTNSQWQVESIESTARTHCSIEYKSRI